MKKKSYFKIFVLAISVVAVLFGCGSKDDGIEQTILLSTDNVEISPEGGSATVKVTSLNNIWSVNDSDTEWCKAEKSDNNVIISAERNTSGENRVATVVVKDATSSKKIQVVQKLIPLKAGLPIEIPKVFKKGLVMNVLDGTNVVAQICSEYVSNIDADSRVVIIYPVVDGKADLTKGFVTKDGGTISWNKETNTNEYAAGTLSTPVTKVYLQEGNIVVLAKDEKATTVVPEKARDIDGNEYTLVKIGTQYWMASNLRTTKFRDGSDIANKQETWQSEEGEITPAYAYMKTTNQETGNSEIINEDVKAYYGALYNWPALYGKNITGTGEVQKLAPEGWKIPVKADWEKLSKYLEANTNASRLLAQLDDMSDSYKNILNWLYPGDNKSGFTAYPAGKIWLGEYYEAGVGGYFWTGTSSSFTEASYVSVESKSAGSSKVTINAATKDLGYSVRCIKE